MPEQSFETQVLVGLEEIKGDIKVIKAAVDNSENRLNKQEDEISKLKALVYKGLGGCAVLAIGLPIVIPRIGG